jgi:L-aminopeptidase/D-esterase-like protein
MIGSRRPVEHSLVAMSTSDRTGTASTTPYGSITDVVGVRVGHHQRIGRGWQTGTTVVIVPAGATPGVDVRGGGPGTRETDALRPENLIEQIHAVCLTGGSAYGLAAADGVVAWLENRGLGFPIGPADVSPAMVVPVVPAAVIFDLGRGGQFGLRPGPGFGERAARNARIGQRRFGSVGAGTGARAGGLQGGIGTASAVVRIQSGGPSGTGTIDVTVGALAVVNANGSVIDRLTCEPWELGGAVRPAPTRLQRRSIIAALDGESAGRLNTTIGVVATSACLTKAEVSKLACVAHDGLARAVRPAHSMFDGDTIFGLATGRDAIPDAPARLRSTGSRNGALNQLLVAAADTFALACTHAVLAATTVGPLPAYSDLCAVTR